MARIIIWAAVLATVAACQLALVCRGQTDESSLSLVTRECNAKLSQLDSLESFEEFMRHYRIVVADSPKPKRGLLNLDGKLRECYDNQEQLFELEQLIREQQVEQNACRQSFVDKLVNYHLQHVAKPRKDSSATQSGGSGGGEGQAPTASSEDRQRAATSGSIRTHYAARVFTLFAHQVTFTCKQQLVARIESAQTQQDCSSVLSSFLPPDVLKAADASPPADTPATSSDNKDEMDEFSVFLSNFKRIEDFALMGKQLGSVGAYFDVVVSPGVLDKIRKLKTLCRAREPHYSALFAPIATLSQLGYDIAEPSVDEILEGRQAKLLKCWLATAQLCQGILRTHVTEDSPEASSDGGESEAANNAGEDDEDDKLVKIKFGQVPADAEDPSSATTAGVPDFRDSVREITQNVIDLVRVKVSLKGKFKRKALNWARKFVEHNIDVDARQGEMAHAFMGALTREDGETDGSVAFNGRKSNHGVFRPATLITDDADSFTQAVSMFVHKEIALIFSSAVAICLSAVFVWFTLYALISSMRSTSAPEPGDNFKANWRELRDKRMQVLDDKVKRRGWKDKLVVYRSPTGR